MVPIIKKQIANNFTDGNFPKKYVVLHETDNFAVGADAMAHYNYWNNNPNAQASANVVIDDKQIIEMMDWFDKSWAVGVIYGDPRNVTDANNYNTINIEICVNADGDYNKARQNAIDYVKLKLPEWGLTSEAVIRHFDCCKKWCPAKMLSNPALWNDFKAQVSGKVAVSTPAPVPVIAPSKPTGSASVAELQSVMNRLGFRGANGLALTVDGLAGTNTNYAVKTFQGIMGLVQDGIAGSVTQGAIAQILSKPLDGVVYPHYEYATRYIQYRVGAGIDGSFGSGTKAKVIDWQRAHGLSADGIVGNASWKALIG